MTIWADHAIFALLAALFPIWALTFGMRRLKRAAPEDVSRVRLSLYRRAMLIQWALSAAVLALWIWLSRSWSEIGLVPRLTPGLFGVAVGFAIVIFFVLRQRREAMTEDDALGRVRAQMRGLELMLPHTREELSWFYRLSLTAGVCEELLYRAFMIWYLSHWLGMVPAVGVAAVLFGFGHSYQGWRGILLTTLVGGFLGAVYLLTGSLLAPMVMHALMDLHSGHLAYFAFEREREQSAAEPLVEPPEGEAVRDPAV